MVSGVWREQRAAVGRLVGEVGSADRPAVVLLLFICCSWPAADTGAVACALEHALWSACPLTHSSLYFLFRLRRMRVLRQSAGASAE